LLSDYAWEGSLGLTAHFDITNLDEYLLPWLKGKVQIMGSWQNHTHSWLDSPLARNGDLLSIRFEDMRRDTEGALAKMVEFLGLSADRELIREVIRNNSLENMRLKEDRSTKYDVNRLGRRSGEEHRFVRKGSVGGWRERLTPAQVQLIEEYTADALSRLGYPILHPSGSACAAAALNTA
jgi:aryl sulfotransferase